jgi:hypothetical protein
MERRRGKEQRQHIDPRYQDAAHREFVNRRKKGDRRKLSYQDLPEHPTYKRIILIGAVIGISLICLFFITNLILTKNVP